MYLGIRIIPLHVFVGVAVVAAFIVRCCGSFFPCVCTCFVFIATVGIAVADIIPMFGAVVGNLQPFASGAVLVYDFFTSTGSSIVV